MGVRGLSTFFNNNPELSKPFKLHDTSVIIDGNNLVHLLYFSNKVDCIYGGDYDRFASSIQKYFKSYTECNIRPIVIFDGGYDVSNRKFKTVLSRSKTRLTLTQHIAKYGECAGNVLPINAQEVFRNVLSEIGISFAQCDYEADDQVTALANHFECPVLSDDSDFYIFDILKGFIRLSFLDLTVVTESDSDGNVHKYLNCSIYYIDKFLSYFAGIDRSILPLFGTLIGNDYVNAKDFEMFFSNIKLPKQKYKGLKINARQQKIIGILSWLQCYSIEEGVKQVLCRFKKERREYVRSMIEQSIRGYKTEACNLVHILNQNIDCISKNVFSNTKLISPCGEVLPLQFVIAFHQGKLPASFLNVINLHQIFLPAQVENVSLDSSYVCSRPIRQVLYGILIQHESSNTETHTKYCLTNIEEYDRRSGSIQRFIVEPLFTSKDGKDLPNLNQVYCLDKEYHKSVLLDVIDDQETIIHLPTYFQLLFGTIKFWLKSSASNPNEEFIYALILCIMYYNILKKFNIKSEPVVKDIQNDDSQHISDLIDNISSSNAIFACKNLKKYTQKPTLNRGNPLILNIVHSFNQLQTCILYISYLNVLLGSPLECLKLQENFSGTMIYNLTKDLLTRPFPDLFISELLGRETSISALFSVLKTELFKDISTDNYMKIDRSKYQKKSNDKKRRQSEESFSKSLPNETDCNQFKNLCSLNVEDDCNEIYI